MFQKKKLLAMLVASALVAACGGGSDLDPVSTTSPATDTNTTPATTPPAGGTSGGSDDTGNTPPTTNPPTNTPTDPVTTPAVDQKFNDHMELVANQLLYIRTNRHLYLPVNMSIFDGSTGLVDIASGSTVAYLPNLAEEAAASGCTIEIDGTCAIQPAAVAPAAPIAAFGIRIGKHLVPDQPGQQVGNQTVVGRIAFDLTERPGSAGVGGTEVPEIMRFIIDNVEMMTDQNGMLTNVRVREGGQIHVYGRNAAGVEVRESIPAPAGTARLLPLEEIPDGYGDTSSTILFMDLETGFSQAGSRLTALHNIAGQFSMSLTLSMVDKIVRPAGAGYAQYPAVEEKDLIGQTITVNTQTPVAGAGISGTAWIRMYPPE